MTEPIRNHEPRHLYANTMRWSPIVEAAISLSWVSLDEQLRRDRLADTKLPELKLKSLVLGQMHQESGGDRWARGRAGEIGLMQLMPSTARDLGLDVPPSGYTVEQVDEMRATERSGRTGKLPPLVWDPQENINAAVRYLHRIFLMLRTKGWSGNALSTYRLALAGYNGGPSFVYSAIRDLHGDELTRHEVPFEMIRTGLVTFSTTFRNSSGRVMPITRKAPPVMVDYSNSVIHHAQQIEALLKLEQRTP